MTPIPYPHRLSPDPCPAPQKRSISPHETVPISPAGAFILAVACATLILTQAASALQAGTLRAGVAKTDITPDQPVKLSGYSSRKDLSQGVHDPLAARVAAFELDNRHLVLVSTDLIGFYSGSADFMRRAILEACDLKPSELFLSATHTHSAPTLALEDDDSHANNIAYTQTLRDQLVQVVQSALERLATVEIGYGYGSSPVGVNRREVVPDDNGNGGSKIELGRNPSVVTDREVQVIKLVHEEQDDPAAILFSYGTHSTSLGPRNYIISGEVFNDIGKTIKSKSPFAHTFVMTHCNGSAGYVPTTPSYPEGGYEVRTSPFAPGADQLLIQETLSLLEELK